MAGKDPKNETESFVPDDGFAMEMEDPSSESWKDDGTVEDGFHDLDAIDPDPTHDSDQIHEEETASSSEEIPVAEEGIPSGGRGKTVLFGVVGLIVLGVAGLGYIQFTQQNTGSSPVPVKLADVTPQKEPSLPQARPSPTPGGEINMALLYKSNEKPKELLLPGDISSQAIQSKSDEGMTDIVVSDGDMSALAGNITGSNAEPRVAKVEILPVPSPTSASPVVAVLAPKPIAPIEDPSAKQKAIDEAVAAVRKTAVEEKTALEMKLSAKDKELAALRDTLTAAQKAKTPAPLPVEDPAAKQKAIDEAVAAVRKAAGEEKTALEAKLSAKDKELAALRDTLTAAQKAKTPAPLPVEDPAAKQKAIDEAVAAVRKAAGEEKTALEAKLSAKDKELAAIQNENVVLAQTNKNLESKLKVSESAVTEKKPPEGAQGGIEIVETPKKQEVRKPTPVVVKKAAVKKPPAVAKPLQPAIAPPRPVVTVFAPPPSAIVLRAATPQAAWIASSKTSSDLKKFVVGDLAPQIGKIVEIRQKDGQWEVVGQHGVLR